MKKRLFTAVLALMIAVPTLSFALGKNYFYRQRATWVKLVKLSNKQLAGVELQHPEANVTPAQMEAMLLSLNLNKSSLFKKGLKTKEVFSIEEAKKLAPYIAQALHQASPNQVVNVALVHARPYFVVRNDFFSMMNIYVADDGMHFNFRKLFAKLNSDYEQASKMDTAINKAKSIRVSLEAGPGQKLAFSDGDSYEVILDPGFDFLNNVDRTVVAEEKYSPAGSEASQQAPRSARKTKVPKTSASEPAYSTASSSGAGERLRQLDDLKAQKLITETEYRQKRKEILGEL